METLLAVVAEFERLNESLHLKVQNKRSHGHLEGILICLIESPYKTVGKSRQGSGCGLMLASLDESPHPKVEKSLAGDDLGKSGPASMKAPPKRMGNHPLIRENRRHVAASMKVPTKL